MVALIHRPPNSTTDFIDEFAELLSEPVTKYDRLLIIGDLNIHVCCGTDSLSKEFLNLMESFDLSQWMDGPSHVHGHTLDLILTHGICVSDTTICELNFSDHKPIIFSVPLVSR